MEDPRIQVGALKYAGKPCKRGHIGTRYAKSMQCVDCAAEYRLDYQKLKDTEALNWIEADDRNIRTRADDRKARAAARARGDHQYDGRRCKKDGTTLRLTNRGICVECNRATNAKAYVKRKAPEVSPEAQLLMMVLLV